MPPRDVRFMVGTTLDDAYVLEALIGEGSMGVVYKARDLRRNTPVAVKLLRMPADDGTVQGRALGAQLLARFEREALVTSQLDTPHVVRLHEHRNSSEGPNYMVLELLSGEGLVDVLERQRRLDPQRVARVGAQICVGLAQVHALGIVHRDIKPENIYLHRDPHGQEVAKIMDFGVSFTRTKQQRGRLTADGSTVGTPTYMSPEQCGGQALDGRADLYSLGVMLFELLTARPPFEAETIIELYMAHAMRPPPKLKLHVASERLHRWQALIETLLAKVPDLRPKTAVSVAATLRELARPPSLDEQREVDERLMSGI